MFVAAISVEAELALSDSRTGVLACILIQAAETPKAFASRRLPPQTSYGVRCGADCKLSGIARFGESGEAISGGCLLAG
jgi:hypothetical protein